MGPFTTIKKSRSFSAVQGGGGANANNLKHHADADDNTISSFANEQTTEDLQETITALRQSVATHANANAETLEHVTTLKKAHDTLYSEHLSLQEQMDDAVELLKYLKEEKSSNETKIKELNIEIGVLKESAGGKIGVGVVSSTIESLTREKMDLEEALKVMEKGRQEAIKNVERYEMERKEMIDRLDEFGMHGTREEGLTNKLALLYEQASSYKEQIRKFEEQSKQLGSYDAKLQTLLSSMTEEKNRANESINKIQSEKDSLMREQETMKSRLNNFQQQEEKISQLKIKLSDSISTIAQMKRERNNSSTPTDGHNELLLENESLKHKIQYLQDEIENYSDSAAQKDDMHAQLEREMQQRLAKRLTEQLQESKVAMETQIRKELEEEYKASSLQQPTVTNKSKSFHSAEISTSQSIRTGGERAPIQLEIEKTLRMQLQQVKEERVRWTNEQEEFQAKVLLSQQQLSQVRDGYKKKLDREKARVTELEAAVSDRESVIRKLSDEYRCAMDELDELQMGQSSVKEALVQQHKEEIRELQIEIDSLSNGKLDQNEKYNKLKKEMDTLEQKYHNNDEELQTSLSQLEQLNLENEECMRKLEAFESSNGSSIADRMEELQAERDTLCTQHNELQQQHECQKEELITTLQQLEALNMENEEYLNKNVALEMAKEAENKCVEEMRRKLHSLEADNNELSSEISNNEEEIQKLEQLTLEIKTFCVETETKLKVVTEEAEQSQSVIQGLEAEQTALSEERDELSAELNAGKEKLMALSKEHETLTLEKEDQLSTIQVLKEEIEQLRSAIASSEVAWQDTVNEASASHEQAVQNYEKKIGTLISEFDGLKEAKSALECQNKENADRIQELVDETTKLNTKDNSQVMRIKELEQENIQLETKLSSVVDEKEVLVSAQSQKVEALISEKEEVSLACDKKIAALTKERDELSEKILSLDKTTEEYKVQALGEINLLTKERDELLKNIYAHENTSCEMLSTSKALQKEESSLREMLNQRDIAKQELETKLSALQESKDNLVRDYESKLSELSSTNSELKQEKIDLSTEMAQMKQSSIDSRQMLDDKIEQLNIELERLKEVNSELANKTATQNTTRNETSVNSQTEIDKLTVELNDAQDKCRVLEGGLEDLQLEKEDLEGENEELATKLADLTTQAKTMLVRNEEMENQLDELAMEYDCRVSELERQLCDLQEKSEDKSSCDEDKELEALGQKHNEAEETIKSLRKELAEAQQKQDEKEAEKNLLKEESLELRQVVDHLQSENDAAREIKYIVLDLKMRNKELVESMRKSRQQKKAAAEIIERLKSDNEKLKNDVLELCDGNRKQLVPYTEEDSKPENQLIPFEADSGDERKTEDMNVELTHYKAIVEKMMSERNIFTQRLSEIMALAPLKRRHSDCDGQLRLEKDTSVLLNKSNVAMLTSGAHLPFTSQRAVVAQEDHAVQAQIQNLTDENANLAQRLGGAVAEKEFAMTTLSELGSKMEELVERNKLLESIADLKSSYAIREGSVYSGHSLSIQDKSRGRATLDPDESVGNSQSQKPASVHKLTNTTTSAPLPQSDELSLQLDDLERNEDKQPPIHGDSNSAFGDSTIVSYEPSVKKLEPEQYVEGYLPADVSVERRNVDAKESVGDRKESVVVSGNPTSVYSESAYLSDLRLIKVPGGEYIGQLNSRGQKHGNGKMRYDNGNEYEGQWKNNKRDGKGTTRYASDNVYIGMWKGGKRHGFGVFHIAKSGDIYRGNWSGGIKSGPGVYEYADGELDVSFYSNDIRVGDGVRWNADRNRASRLFDGKLVGIEGDFPVDDAMRLTKKLGFVV